MTWKFVSIDDAGNVTFINHHKQIQTETLGELVILQEDYEEIGHNPMFEKVLDNLTNEALLAYHGIRVKHRQVVNREII